MASSFTGWNRGEFLVDVPQPFSRHANFSDDFELAYRLKAETGRSGKAKSEPDSQFWRN